jgi:hypothetical protein
LDAEIISSHTSKVPVIAPGIDGEVRTIARDFVALVAHGDVALTVIEVPATKLLSYDTVTIVSFTPAPPGCEVMVAPAGTDQL